MSTKPNEPVGSLSDGASKSMSQVFIRSPLNYDVKAASDDTAVGPGGPSLTVQAQAEDTDINVMMKRMGITGKFPENPRVPSYGDFSHIKDFRSALEAVAAGEAAFMEYPADFRARFENNPQLFLDFVENPANIDEMKKMGLFKESSNVSSNVGTGSGAGASAGTSGGVKPPVGDSKAGGADASAKSG